MHDTWLQEEPVKKKAKKAEATPKANGAADDGASRTIFMKNMPFSADEDAIKDFFSDCGETTEIRIGESTPP